MTYTSVLAFFILFCTWCIERMIHNYNEHGASISAIGPWFVLLFIALFFMLKIDIYAIAIESEMEIHALLESM